MDRSTPESRSPSVVALERVLKARDSVSRRYRRPLQWATNWALFGLVGSRPPIGLANAERWIARATERGRFHRLSPMESSRIPPWPSISAGDLDSGEKALVLAGAGEPSALRVLPRSVAWVHGATVAGHTGEVITPDRLLLCDLALDQPITLRTVARNQDQDPFLDECASLVARSKVAGRGPLPRARKLDGTLAVLATHSSRNYYHWLIDALPHLGWLEEAGIAVDRYYTPLSSAYHAEGLALLGISSDDCVASGRRRVVQPTSVALPSTHPGLATQASCDFLWRRLLPPALAASSARTAKRLYISRRDAHWRKVVNEAEVMSFLGQRGFEMVSLEEHSLADQIRMFNDAEFIIGPHGAGLTNLAFCREGTQVLEISSPRRANECFHHIAHWRRLRYLNLVATQAGAAAHAGSDSNMEVKLTHLEQAMALVER